MSTMLVITLLSSLFGWAVSKDWFGAGKWTDIQQALVRMCLAFIGFVGLQGEELLKGQSSFFEAIAVVIGVYCGVISSFVVMEKIGSKKKPVFVDDLSILGWSLLNAYGEKVCRWLYVGEVLIYLLTVLR